MTSLRNGFGAMSQLEPGLLPSGKVKHECWMLSAQARPRHEFGLLHRLPERQSKCEVEVDACVEDILNRQEVSNSQECLPVCARHMHQPKGVHHV